MDSPNGRVGDEPVEILANQRGEYILVVRPFPSRLPEKRPRELVERLGRIAAAPRVPIPGEIDQIERLAAAARHAVEVREPGLSQLIPLRLQTSIRFSLICSLKDLLIRNELACPILTSISVRIAATK